MVSHPVLFNLLLLLPCLCLLCFMKPFKSWLEEFEKQATEVSNASNEVSSAVNALCFGGYTLQLSDTSCCVNKIIIILIAII